MQTLLNTKIISFMLQLQSGKVQLFTEVTEQPCDWLHLFGGHGFYLLGTGRAKCAWVPSESQNAQKRQS